MRNETLLLNNLTVKQARDYLKSKGIIKIPTTEDALITAYDILKRKEVTQ